MASASNLESLGRYWRSFADYSLQQYAPKYDRIVRAMADDPDVLALVAEGPPDAQGPNNLQGAVHYLLFDLPDHPLSAIYRGESDADPAPLFRELALDHRSVVLPLLQRKVQTNEVARCATVAPALGEIAATSDQPLSLIDIGCSAGLNLGIDGYRIDYGHAAIGPEDSPVLIEASIDGDHPPLRDVDLAWRRGYDRSPIDVTDPDAARWLRSLIWPDHPERGRRLDAAISLAVADPPTLVTADAVDAVQSGLEQAPVNTLVVILTTWTVFYFDDETRRAFAAAIEAAARPVVWLSMEMEGVVQGVDAGPQPESDGEVSLMATVNNDGRGTITRRALGWTQPHGAWSSWTA